jgi:hypothetical protein
MQNKYWSQAKSKMHKAVEYWEMSWAHTGGESHIGPFFPRKRGILRHPTPMSQVAISLHRMPGTLIIHTVGI